MAQPNKREEQDKDPRTSKKQGNPLETSNPTVTNLQRPNAENKITDDKNQQKDTSVENEEGLQDTSGGA